eukprot:TRINITY_DN488_c0_g1_i15.p1 TRINITY_DN488_c0_g1~~TRINITY_DN488_c0_g1_i15.p1  ORF type:complete len:111 (+),score=5.84 TRINITY_DN488_c0_g1_i15:175-507(+)
MLFIMNPHGTGNSTDTKNITCTKSKGWITFADAEELSHELEEVEAADIVFHAALCCYILSWREDMDLLYCHIACKAPILLAIRGVLGLSLIHICRCRRLLTCRSRWSPYH